MTTTIATEEDLHGIAAASGMEIPWHQITDGAAYVIEQDGEVIFAVGFVDVWEGCGQSWSVTLSDKIEKPIAFTKEAKRLLDRIMSERNYRQLRVTSTTPEGIRWNETLGFKLECVWEAAGPNHEDIFFLVYHRRH